jgi:uncharacterized protein involved in exopolysaccharide biosynthesis/Mrp family chromosome partitioning ATPase
MSVADVWYALFRHKWKVLILSTLGVVAAGALYVKNKPPSVSEAKLLVRYVVESRSLEALGPDGQVRAAQGTAAANVINSEGEIIRSMDLCRQVAESIGPEKILAGSKFDGVTNLTAAAGVLYEGLDVEIPKLSNVIKIGLAHPDPEIAQRALQQLIEFYFKKHVEIHRGLGTMDAVLAQQTDQIRSRLIQTDQEIQDLRNRVGVLSLDDSRKAITEQMGSIRQMILTAEAELAEYQLLARTNLAPAVIPPAMTNAISASQPAKLAVDSSVTPAKLNPSANPVPAPVPERSAEYRKGLVTRVESLRRQEQDLRELRTAAGAAATDGKNNYNDQIGRVRQMILTAETELAEYSAPAKGAAQPVATAGPSAPQSVAVPVKTPAVASSGSNVLETEVSTPTPERFTEYKALMGRLEALRRQEIDLRNIYKDQNPTLIRVREQLAEAEANRKAIEKENPTFASYFSPENARSTAASSSAGSTPVMLPSSGGLDPNRARALAAKLKVLNAQMEKQKQEATALELFETQFNQLQRKRELDEKNYRHFSAGLEQSRFDEALGSGKLANISVVQSPSPAAPSQGKRMKLAGMALGAGVVGGIALALLIELMLDHTVRRSTQLETALALPLLSTIPWIRVGARRPRLQIGNGDLGALEKNGGAGPDIPGWSPGHPLRPHIEALRDRTLMHFEGDLRKPKLIGVTACRDGAGATTIACALAAALSESADGRVLLINLDAGSQSLHPLLLGQQARSVVDVVEAGDRETAMIGNNLYVASGYGDGSGNTVLHPTSIARMLPKIKMSDYDYVVFDMPIVSPTSITSKLAGMVDLVFMVAESEKDSQNKLKRACQLLTESNATFRIVLNKFERYVPKWLDHEA